MGTGRQKMIPSPEKNNKKSNGKNPLYPDSIDYRIGIRVPNYFVKKILNIYNSVKAKLSLQWTTVTLTALLPVTM